MKKGNELYWISLLLIIIWFIGFMGYKLGAIIHLLLGLALILMVWKVIQTLRLTGSKEDFDKNKALK
jgi:uncharacterized membrane protein YqjE